MRASTIGEGNGLDGFGEARHAAGDDSSAANLGPTGSLCRTPPAISESPAIGRHAHGQRTRLPVGRYAAQENGAPSEGNDEEALVEALLREVRG